MAIRSQTENILLVLLIVGSGCRADPTIGSPNLSPIADARIVRDGVSIDARTSDAGAAALTFAFSGSPLTIALDGSHSLDPDGMIRGYRWLSATPVPDGGTVSPNGTVHLRVPEGQAPNWPEDVEQPQVTLGEGVWSFMLQVTDDQGAISKPDVVKITIGTVVDPVVKQCADAVVATEPEACRQCLCKQSDMCRAAVVSTACDQGCWDLVNCVAAKCPDFAAMAAMTPPDISCLTMNCSAYLSGSTGATPVAPCFRACPNDCPPVMPGTRSDGGT